MLILLGVVYLVICLLGVKLIVYGSKQQHIYDDAWIGVGFFFAIIFGIILIIDICVASSACYDIKKSSYIPEKIEMYQLENKNIESDMDELVKQYMTYEKETFKSSKSTSSITLVSLYPELKSDKLVSKQLEVYVHNNNKIKKLKESYIDAKVARWWVYFG